LNGFNHTSLQKAFAEHGIKYTMADKNAESIPFIHIDEVSFLKRSFVYSVDLCAYIAPLDEKSIHKMLSVWVRSRTISSQEQMIAVMSPQLGNTSFMEGLCLRRRLYYFKE